MEAVGRGRRSPSPEYVVSLPASNMTTYIKVYSYTRLTGVLALLVSFALPTAHAQGGPQPKLPTVPLTAGMYVIQAEVAQTPEQQATGMMFRREIGQNEGMLFFNREAGVRCFWMRNTLLPLSIAFVADDGTIVNTAEMQPQSDESHCSTKPVRFALEMRQGWFAKRGIGAGFKLRGVPFGN